MYSTIIIMFVPVYGRDFVTVVVVIIESKAWTENNIGRDLPFYFIGEGGGFCNVHIN